MKKRGSTHKRFVAVIISSFLALNLLYSPSSFAQVAFLPAVGSMVALTPKFNPLLVKGVKLYPDNPFKFDFIVDKGDTHPTDEQVKEQGQKLFSYFLAALTTPEKEMWVNLSPYEKSRIIPAGFGDTEMGKELLAQDYILKQIMATALYPERTLGKAFWQKVYATAAQRFGTTQVPVNTFNKVWILPKEAVIYENAKMNTVFVVQSSLKVMLEQDYLAANKAKAIEQFEISAEGGSASGGNQHSSDISAMSSQIIKEIVIPALEKEVNEGSNFANLRQVYQALILADWYKKNFKDNVLAKGYINQGKTLGVDTQDKQITQKIYQQYLRAYKKGAYNYIKEEIDPATNQVIPRKYFSGGLNFSKAMVTKVASLNQVLEFSRNSLGRLLSIKAVAGLLRKNDEILRVDFRYDLKLASTESFRSIVRALSNKQENSVNKALRISFLDDEEIHKVHRELVDNPDKEVIRVKNGFEHSFKMKGDMLSIVIKRVDQEHVSKPVTLLITSIIEAIAAAVGSSQIMSGGSGGGEGGGAGGAAGAAALAKYLDALREMVARAMAGAGMASTSLPSAATSNPSQLAAAGEPVGGIDLEKLNTMIKGDKGMVKTAFNDPRILQLLLDAKGLSPEVESVTAMPAPMVSVYLGLTASP